MRKRRLTLSRAFRDSTARDRAYRRPIEVPFLRVQGKWLEQAGFTIGDRVNIEVQPGRLIVTTEEER